MTKQKQNIPFVYVKIWEQIPDDVHIDLFDFTQIYAYFRGRRKEARRILADMEALGLLKFDGRRIKKTIK